MGTWTGFYPRLYLSLGIWLMIAAHTLQNTKAEITCASCPSPVQLHADKMRLGIYSPPKDEAVTLKNIRVEFRELTEQNSDHEKGDSAGNAHHLLQKDTLDEVSAKETSSWYSKENYNGTDGSEKGEDDALWRGKRTLSESAEFRDNGWTGALDDRELKKREDATENNRQDEPKLISSTFALAGDSAHNHAVVYWSGQNSSVILILTKLYDFHIGSVTESSLWRSTDYGSTYERMDEKIGSKTILGYLYVCPTNNRKIMVLTDPDFESSVLISSDEGASYQKYRLTFYVLSLLFHPTEEDWALAHSHDQKLYISVDFGRKWQLIHKHVTPNRFY